MSVVYSSLSKARNKKLDKDGERIAKSFKQFQITAEAEADWRKQGLEDLKFRIGTGQWDEAVKADREVQGKPCLTINRGPAFLRQYTGEARQHRPAMIVSPVGSGASVEAAKIHQGVLRHVEVASFADIVYDDAYEMMMIIGSCPARVAVDYVTEMSFDQEPRIEKIDNPFDAYLSPIRRPDGNDPLWAHVMQYLSREEYEEKYPKSSMTTLKFPALDGGAPPEWVHKDGVTIAEYWWIELTSKTICLLPDGTSQLKEKLPADLLPLVVDERDTITREVKCVRHNAIEILETYEWLGKYIPIPELNGVRLNVNGKLYKSGMIRDYRDAQRIYDFMVTRQVEHVDLYSKDPLWIPEGNSNHEEEYRQMNRKNTSHQYYKAYDEQGRQLPPPNRIGRDVPIEAMSKIIQQADYDMKSVIGIYGPGLGEQGPENESGFSILTRQQQSDTGMVAWHDNLNRFIRWTGIILLDLWPKYIDKAKLQRIINPDDSVKHAAVFNSKYGDSSDDAQHLLDEQAGLKKAYDVGVGEYDVTLSTGPMYRTARQEAFRALTVVIGQKPELLPILGDIWAKNADFPDANILSDRFKKMLPPELQDSSSDDLQSKLQQAQAQLAAMSQQHNQLVAELNRAADTIRTNRLKIESSERIALHNNWTQLMLQRMKSNDAAAQAQMDAQLGSIAHRLETLHENMSVEEDAGEAPATPELPGKVEPKVQPITPAAPVTPVQPIA